MGRLEDAKPNDHVSSREGDLVIGCIEGDEVVLAQIDAVRERPAQLKARVFAARAAHGDDRYAFEDSAERAYGPTVGGGDFDRKHLQRGEADDYVTRRELDDTVVDRKRLQVAL